MRMKIGELARAAGLTVPTIRYYEAEGLLPSPRRTPSGYRTFGPDALDRLAFIKQAQRLGLSLAEIKDILAIQAQQQPTCGHVRSLLEARVDAADRALRELTEFRDQLARLVAQSGALEDCRPSGGRICGIIEQASFTAQPGLLQRLKPGERHPLA